MKVLLVNPVFPKTFWGLNFISKFINIKAMFAPLGLLTVGGMLSKDWEVKLIDMNVKSLKDKDIAWADMVFISFSMLIQDVGKIQAIINRCKDLGKIVVGGGEGFTTKYKEFENVDYFVLGEGELTIPRFLSDLKDGNPKPIYFPVFDERADLTKSPIPLLSLINSKDYATVLVQTSRGCPFNCDFCDVTKRFGKKMRFKNISQIIAELDTLKKAGFSNKNVFFADDNFIGNPKRAKELLRDIIAWQKENKYLFSFLTQASINLAKDKELMEFMSEANFKSVFIGVESPNEESIIACGKIQNKVDIASALKTIQGYGLETMIGLIVGFDNDGHDIFKMMIDFVQKTCSPTAMLGLLDALPGTKLWERLREEGRILRETSGNNTAGILNFMPKLMTPDQLVDGWRNLVKNLYSPKFYAERVDKFLVNCNPKVKKKITFSDLKAFFHANWRIGIFSKFRFVYWRTIIRTFFGKREVFPMAVQLYITGFCQYKMVKIVLKG